MPRRAQCQLPQSLIIIFAITSSAAGVAHADESVPKPIYAKALEPGDTIMFVAPAKYLDKERVMLAKKRLEERGYKVKLPEDLFRKHGFLGGTDDERAAEIMAAFTDPEVKAIFPGTGGYGTTRIVDKLDYDVIRRNPKILIGFSDITGLHIAINQRTGLVTFHTPNAEFGLGNENNLTPFADKWFWRALEAKSYPNPLNESRRVGYTIYSKPTEVGEGDARAFPDGASPTLFEGMPEAKTYAEGKAQGRLIGGNLSVVHALMGTPYEIQTDGKILLLEDIGEAPYRVDRMLSTMKLAGKFDHLKGVVLGAFTARDEEPKWDDDASIDDVLRGYFENLGVPVLAFFPVGHVPYNATLPEGGLVELDATAQTIRLLENPVQMPGR